ncbi:hypothetical protein [Xanthomonas phage Carpasina]|uniref:Uncharacterized protein n=1 Tax=Xanthomonas phage Carpasina TaxID=2163636 RepID=A0A2S1GSS1_9CAUD|nr:hypothetical protein HOT16_gp50 [Xanthomonas phage Carpasina]AWD92445.1 hypothetical protein [Xanthomonas phage Carpasina]
MECDVTGKTIIGAGLAGLMSACVFKDASIIDAMPEPKESHKALLRFRDESVSILTGIPFKKVHVYKEVFEDGKCLPYCTNRAANLYAQKVTGHIAGRSIRNLESVARYVAPDDFYGQLLGRFKDRIEWGKKLESEFVQRSLKSGHVLINTAPLGVITKTIGVEVVGDFSFDKKAIQVDRYLLPEGSDVYQTVYFPDPAIPVYRASITGRMLIVESIGGDFSQLSLPKVRSAFGLRNVDLEPLDSVDQKYGKIVDLPREVREAVLHELSKKYNIFSVGRFATWRNILLDDVVNDIYTVDRLVRSSGYGRSLLASSI